LHRDDAATVCHELADWVAAGLAAHSEDDGLERPDK